MAAAVFAARVAGAAQGELAARVLPRLPLVVPMEADFGKLGGDLAGLLLVELNPNPIPDNYQTPCNPNVNAPACNPNNVYYCNGGTNVTVLPTNPIVGASGLYDNSNGIYYINFR